MHIQGADIDRCVCCVQGAGDSNLNDTCRAKGCKREIFLSKRQDSK